MSALELTGPLRMLCSMPHRLKGRQLNVLIDNSGSVIMYKKGYSTKCYFCCTLLTVKDEVALALDIRIIGRSQDRWECLPEILMLSRRLQRLIPILF